MTDQALKPCPFCGSKAAASFFYTESKWSKEQVEYTTIECMGDGCGVMMSDEDDVIGRWNSRYAELEQTGKFIPIGQVVTLYGDPEAFAEKDFEIDADASDFKAGTKVFARVVD